jgi:hypothetical protein
MVAEPLLVYLRAEPLPNLRARMAQILAGAAQANPQLLDAVVDAVRTSPEEVVLLQAFWDRLSSSPEAIARLEALFHATGSTQVKLSLLQLLEESEAVSLFTPALTDPSPWVRRAAVRWCRRHARKHSGPISAALVSRIAAEPVTHVRAEMIGVLGAMGRLDATTERFVVRWLSQETSPEGQQILAALLPDVTPTEENRRDILRAYLKVLREPFFDETLKARVGECISAFLYRDEQDLKVCLEALMERATDLIEVESLYAQLRTLELDALALVPLKRKLLYRFIGQYPQAPLDAWLRDLAAASAQYADLRSEIPYLVRLTGATWILDKAEPDAQKATVLPALLDAIRHSRHLDSQRLLDDAYKRRTLRKSDAIALFRQLLTYHDTYPLLDSLLRILQETKIITADIVAWSVSWLCQFPGATAAYGVQQYLLGMGPLESSYFARIEQAFSAENYRRYRLLCGVGDRQRAAYRHWDDYWSPSPSLRDWPIAELFFAQASPEAIVQKLDTSPSAVGEAVPQSFQYLLLAHLHQQRAPDEAMLLAAGRLMRTARALLGAELLHDRALYVLDKQWPAFAQTRRGNPIPPDLSRMAAEAFVELCARRQALGPDAAEREPAPLTGMDLDHCQAVWPLGAPAWEAVWDRYAGYLEKPTSTLFARTGATAPNRAKQPLGFSPLPAQAHAALLDFLFYTPLGSDPRWVERWQRMLRAARWHGSFGQLLSGLPEPERQRILGLLA